MFITLLDTELENVKETINVDDIHGYRRMLNDNDKTIITFRSDRADFIADVDFDVIQNAVKPINLTDTIDLTNEKYKTPIEEKYKITLVNYYSDKKITVIKVLRELFMLGLKEAKDMSESLPIVLAKDCNKEFKNRIKEKLEEASGILEIEIIKPDMEE